LVVPSLLERSVGLFSWGKGKGPRKKGVPKEATGMFTWKHKKKKKEKKKGEKGGVGGASFRLMSTGRRLRRVPGQNLSQSSASIARRGKKKGTSEKGSLSLGKLQKVDLRS